MARKKMARLGGGRADVLQFLGAQIGRSAEEARLNRPPLSGPLSEVLSISEA